MAVCRPIILLLEPQFYFDCSAGVPAEFRLAKADGKLHSGELRMRPTPARVWLWMAFGGIAIGVAGVAWDKAWHQRHPDALAGAREVLEAHWLIAVGIVIIFIAMLAAVRVLRQPRSAAVSAWMSFAGALAMVIGFIWDSIRHIQGTESATAHALMYAGLALAVVGIPAALALLRNSRRAPL